MQVLNIPFKNWRVDPDGLLRVTACVLKDGVYEYGAEEFEALPDVLQGVEVVREYIPVSELDRAALQSLEGKQVTVATSDADAHEWRHPENASTDGLAVGAVAGVPRVRDGELLCDLVITDADAISRIKSGELVEVSAGYNGGMVVESGEWQGQPYDAIQTDIRFNHVLLLPPGGGRCGADVRILNSKQNRGLTMAEKSHVVKLQFRNGTRTYRFANEEDREEAERMANEAGEEKVEIKAEEVENALARCNELKSEIEAKNAELEESRKVIEEFKDKLASALDPEAQEALASELLDQAADEEAIMESEVDAEDRAVLENARKNCKTRKARRDLLVKHILNKRGVNADTWTDDAIAGAFATLTIAARARHGNRIPNAGVRANSANAPRDTFARMMSGYDRNKGGKNA